MNNKGLAISVIIYMIIIVFSMLIFSTVIFTDNNNKVKSEALEDAKSLLDVYQAPVGDSSATQVYRYVTSDGSWSNWVEYENLSEVDQSVNLNVVPNMGAMGDAYDLDATDVVLNIVDGEAYLTFNGTTSMAQNILNSANGRANSIYIEFKPKSVVNSSSASKNVLQFNTTLRAIRTGAFTSNLENETLGLLHESGERIGTTTSFNADELLRIAYVWNPSISTYDFYLNGVANQGRITYLLVPVFEYDFITLGASSAGTGNLDMDLYNITISADTLTKTEALDITDGTRDVNDVMTINTADLVYGDFIQFSEYVEDISEASGEESDPVVFDARYIRDYVNGSNNNTGNHIVELKAMALYQEGDVIGGVEVGGSYTGTFSMNIGWAGTANNGEIQVTAGTYISPVGTEYTMSSDEEICSNFEGAVEVVGLAYIMFIGSHPGDFVSVGNNIATTSVSDLFIPVYYSGATWYYNNNSGWTAFTPSSEDYIVGFIETDYGDDYISRMSICNYPFLMNASLSKGATGSVAPSNSSRVADGDLTMGNYSSYGSGSRQYVETDLWYEIPIKEVRVWHYYNSRTYYETADILYNSDRSSTFYAHDYRYNGLHREISSGMSFIVE